MNMKTMFLGLALALTCGIVRGETESTAPDAYQYLYWAVTPRGSYEFSGAALYAVQDGNKTLIDYQYVPGSTLEKPMLAKANHLGGTTPGPEGDALRTDITGYGAETSFYLELMGEKIAADGTHYLGTVLGLYNYWSYDTLLALEAIDGFTGGDPTGVNHVANKTWTPQNFVIPEPTSGLLVLFGVCALAMRRRKAEKILS